MHVNKTKVGVCFWNKLFSWRSQPAAFHCYDFAVGKDQDSLVTAHKTLIFLQTLKQGQAQFSPLKFWSVTEWLCYTTQPGPMHKSGTPADKNDFSFSRTFQKCSCALIIRFSLLFAPAFSWDRVTFALNRTELISPVKRDTDLGDKPAFSLLSVKKDCAGFSPPHAGP